MQISIIFIYIRVFQYNKKMQRTLLIERQAICFACALRCINIIIKYCAQYLMKFTFRPGIDKPVESLI